MFNTHFVLSAQSQVLKPCSSQGLVLYLSPQHFYFYFFLRTTPSSSFLSKALVPDTTPNAASSSDTVHKAGSLSSEGSPLEGSTAGPEFIYPSVCSAQEGEEPNSSNRNSTELGLQRSLEGASRTMGTAGCKYQKN